LVKNSFDFYLFPFYLALIFTFYLFTCSKTPSSPEGITFSGTVTLEGQADNSGVTVMLFKPVEMDTALTNVRLKHPNVGIPLNQRTEFYWREHTPAYQATTDASGAWKIDGVESGVYNIVAKKEGFGWRVKYDTGASGNSISLKKAIVWNGTFSQSLSVPAGSFVSIEGNTTFAPGAQLTVGAGSILEFRNSSSLTVSDRLTLGGASGNEIYVTQRDTANFSRLNIEQGDNSQIDYAVFFNLKNGVYIKNSNNLTVKHCRFKMAKKSIEIFNGNNAQVENNVISEMNNGLITQETNLLLIKNLIVNNKENGLKSLSAKNSIVQNNIFKNNNKNGLGLNLGGYAFSETDLSIFYNDFESNETHIFLGTQSYCIANNNNFYKEKRLIVFSSSNIKRDSLNFQNNYWNYFNAQDISAKIIDRLDRIGQQNPGPVVDFTGIKTEYVQW